MISNITVDLTSEESLLSALNEIQQTILFFKVEDTDDHICRFLYGKEDENGDFQVHQTDSEAFENTENNEYAFFEAALKYESLHPEILKYIDLVFAKNVEKNKVEKYHRRVRENWTKKNRTVTSIWQSQTEETTQAGQIAAGLIALHHKEYIHIFSKFMIQCEMKNEKQWQIIFEAIIERYSWCYETLGLLATRLTIADGIHRPENVNLIFKKGIDKFLEDPFFMGAFTAKLQTYTHEYQWEDLKDLYEPIAAKFQEADKKLEYHYFSGAIENDGHFTRITEYKRDHNPHETFNISVELDSSSSLEEAIKTITNQILYFSDQSKICEFKFGQEKDGTFTEYNNGEFEFYNKCLEHEKLKIKLLNLIDVINNKNTIRNAEPPGEPHRTYQDNAIYQNNKLLAGETLITRLVLQDKKYISLFNEYYLNTNIYLKNPYESFFKEVVNKYGFCYEVLSLYLYREIWFHQKKNKNFNKEVLKRLGLKEFLKNKSNQTLFRVIAAAEIRKINLIIFEMRKERTIKAIINDFLSFYNLDQEFEFIATAEIDDDTGFLGRYKVEELIPDTYFDYNKKNDNEFLMNVHDYNELFVVNGHPVSIENVEKYYLSTSSDGIFSIRVSDEQFLKIDELDQLGLGDTLELSWNIKKLDWLKELLNSEKAKKLEYLYLDCMEITDEFFDLLLNVREFKTYTITACNFSKRHENRLREKIPHAILEIKEYDDDDV